ncbi:hypothetical protein GGI12_003009 [Dipsacomyces acuminosporus]|nr:hypothetical protein GGI12_003009 [Dipsacomyces acuminosporus]
MKLFFDSALNKIPVLRRYRQSATTLWAASSLFLFIDTFIYCLTVADLPDILQTQMHVSESENGIMTSIFGIGGLLGGLISGLLSDRYHTRRSLQLLAAATYTVAGMIFYHSKHFYQLLIFRLINGIASGIACTMLYTVVGDVYPANLLGFKVSIVYFFNNIAYTVGPIAGQRVFGLAGIHGTASIVIAFGLLEVFLLLTVVEESLVVRQMVKSCEATKATKATAAASPLSSTPLTPSFPSSTAPDVIDKASIASEQAMLSQTRVLGDGSEPTTERSNGDVTIPIWRLIFHLPVLVSTVSIIVAMGIQCTLEGVVPLHIKEKFDMSSGMTYVIYGLALTVFVPCVGELSNWLIRRCGEKMRYYLMLFGSIATIFSILVIALAQTYAVMMVGYVFFAFTNLCMFIPGQSAYGDFVNNSNVNSMAQSYAISTLSWSVGAISLPPIGSALYSTAGFAMPLIGIACKELHESKSENGLITTVFGVGSLLAVLSIGYLSDRMQSRLFPQMSACVLYIIARVILMFATKFYHVILLRLVLGASFSIADTMLFTTVADVYPANLPGLKMTIAFVFDSIGSMLDPVASGEVYEDMGIRCLKFGLNVRKPLGMSTGTKNETKLKSVFTDAPEDTDTVAAAAANQQKIFAGGSQTHAAEKLAADLETADPSIYAYDELYDDIKDARGRIKQAQKSTDLKPRYMEKLIETAKKRQIQQDMVKEKIIEKERLREGEMYKDKETFVTSGYKEQKEQRKKLVEEEEQREKQEEEEMKARGSRNRNGGLMATGFYRGFLDRIDKDDVGKAVAIKQSTGDEGSNVQSGDLSTEQASERRSIGAGLNVISKSTKPRGSGPPPPEAIDYNGSNSTQQHSQRVQGLHQESKAFITRGHSRASYSDAVEQQQIEQEAIKQREQQAQEDALLRKYARRNDEAAIEAARQRYFERKRARELEPQPVR